MPIINTIANSSGRGYGFTRGSGGPILISANPGPSASVTTYSGYIVFSFTSTGTLEVGAGSPGNADVFVVGGGYGNPGATGGAGGDRTTSPNFAVIANSPIPVVVGGAASNSTFGPVTSSGGTAGGAGGTSNGNGSNGPTNDYLTGSPAYYGGGGGAGRTGTAGLGAAGGLSGGGTGGRTLPAPGPSGGPAGATGTSGAANTGGGGGGYGVGAQGNGGNTTGGSGIVIVRFPDTQFRTS